MINGSVPSFLFSPLCYQDRYCMQIASDDPYLNISEG